MAASTRAAKVATAGAAMAHADSQLEGGAARLSALAGAATVAREVRLFFGKQKRWSMVGTNRGMRFFQQLVHTAV